ncbi:MAG: hypothetical protein EPO20_17635 [Betaproteobacteria bacterium]|nr:MAG: hypothetical protein EPO20_17635 [Betaproteobacteria bacterium]
MKSLVLALAAVFALAACTEETQVTMYKEGAYKGKPDQLPWNNAPPPYGMAKWDKGDKTSWEQQLGQRVMAQNESVRIEHR